VAELGLLNSYAGLSLPLIASATATFLFRQFFLSVPDELVEAARNRRRRPHALFQGHSGALVQDLDCRTVRDPVHLWLEPVPVASSHDHLEDMYPVVVGIKSMLVAAATPASTGTL
jgi:sn-glycerol 3-phosphate transport system permease protein